MSQLKANALAARNFVVAEQATTLPEALELFAANSIVLKKLDLHKYGAYGVVIGQDNSGYYFFRTTGE